jgi:lipopolysaccharide export system protein LptC
MTHNPQDGSYDIQQPVITKLDTESPMTLRAARAHVTSDNSQVHLHDNVRMYRPASQNNEPLQVTSEYLLLLPDDDVAKTDKPVAIKVGESQLNGTGMVANNATRELQLASSVHGTYQAPRRELRIYWTIPFETFHETFPSVAVDVEYHHRRRSARRESGFRQADERRSRPDAL